MTENRFPEAPPAEPVYLTGVSTAEARGARRGDLGVLIQPGNSTHLDVETGAYELFGADNGFYGLGSKADPSPEKELAAARTWGAWVVDVVAPLRDRCAFVTIPDVLNWITLPNGKRVPVGDAEGTLARFHLYASHVRDFGLPAALVLQDGLRLEGEFLVAGAERVSWADLDAVFVGASDEFKLGPVAAEICREARRRGKWAHVGRVNSWKRLAIVRDYADSVDGTFLGFGPSKNWPRLEGWLDRLLAERPFPFSPAIAA